MIHLDTQVVVWLHEKPRRLSRTARRLIERNDAVMSPVVELELSYLHEIGRLRPTPGEVLEGLAARIGLTPSAAQASRIVRYATGLSWTRDVFDRLIVGNSLADAAPLLTADPRILENVPTAVWD